ncbi:MAG: hypothetical protein LBG58_08170 [Planctomycetaceae bacterium]|jgi:hypothetical protein|nr:hypothetical protein [Planctomycetaceae bacterium]
MKKIFGSLTMVVMFTVAYFVAMSLNPQWEKSNGDVVGGVCYLTSENPTGYCQNDSYDCGAKECKWITSGGYWTCDAIRALEKLTNSWRSEISISEVSGYKSYVNTTIVCHNVYTCNYNQSVPNCTPVEVQETQEWEDTTTPPVTEYRCVNNGPPQLSIPKTHQYVDILNTPVCY